MNNLSKYIELLKNEKLLVSSDIDSGRDPLISGISFDSRNVKENFLFVCKGNGFRESFLDMAMAGGAAAYVSETAYPKKNGIIVNDVRKAMAVLSNMFYERPWEKLKLVGITGTKGKTTSLYYLKNIMNHSAVCGENKFGYLSTIDTFDGKNSFESHLTTPESAEIGLRLSNMVQSGINAAVMEVSSQALKYDRCSGIEFEIGCFTNFGEDHISDSEHSDIEDYFASKLRLFSQCKTAVINLDSDRADMILAAAKKSESVKKIITYSSHNYDADYVYGNLRRENGFTVFYLSYIGEIRMMMPGLFNAENAVCAAIIARLLGASGREIISGLLDARVPGRMEVFKDSFSDRFVICDFAHNAMSFETLFKSVRSEYPGYKIRAVFGAPGDKAFSRRDTLPEIAAKYADYVYLTTDDPGEEDPMEIAQVLLDNLHKAGGVGEIIIDRQNAVCTAIKSAPSKTVVLLLAKGNDTTMRVGKDYIPIRSDSQLAEELLG